MGFCTQCGAPLEDGEKFCTNCGSRVEEPETTVDATPAVADTPTVQQVRPVVPAERRAERVGQAAAAAASARTGTATAGTATANAPASGSSKTLAIALACLLVGALGAAIFMHGQAGVGEGTGADGTAVVSGNGSGGDGGSESSDADDGKRVEGITVRSSLSSYSWGEIAAIAQLMEDSGTRPKALDLAKSFNLTDDSGNFPSGAKVLKLRDGTQLRMRLVDVMHDKISGAGGKTAGMTFLASEVSHHGRMAPKTTTDGGWEDSEMRSWLNGTVLDELPDEIAGSVVAVDKFSNNIGKTRSTSCVYSTSDYLWLPSIVELCGNVDWRYDSDPGNSPYYNSVFNAEGSQYAYFAQKHVDSENDNSCLALGEIWWMRSTAASSGRGRYVTAGGDPSRFGDSCDSHGVVIGFCL